MAVGPDSRAAVSHRLSAWVRRPWAWVLLGVVLLAAIAATLRFAPFVSVSTVTVVGNTQVSADEVRAAAALPEGTPMLVVPMEEVEERVESLDAVADARVSRNWPDELRIVVRERRPVGYVALSVGAGVVGSDGTIYRVDVRPPDGLPQLPAPSESSRPVEEGDSYTGNVGAADVAAFEVARSLPPSFQRKVVTVTAETERSIVLMWHDGVEVRWGSTNASASKVDVVDALQSRASQRSGTGWGKAFTVVDVSAPDAPALLRPDS